MGGVNTTLRTSDQKRMFKNLWDVLTSHKPKITIASALQRANNIGFSVDFDFPDSWYGTETTAGDGLHYRLDQFRPSTPLTLAVYREIKSRRKEAPENSFPITRYLVETAHADVNKHDKISGFTPLRFAIDRSDLPMVAYLLHHGADPGLDNIPPKNRKFNQSGDVTLVQQSKQYKKSSPLNAALDKVFEDDKLRSRKGPHLDIVRLLVEHYPLQKRKKLFEVNDIILKAIELVEPDLVTLLLQNGADPQRRITKDQAAGSMLTKIHAFDTLIHQGVSKQRRTQGQFYYHPTQQKKDKLKLMQTNKEIIQNSLLKRLSEPHERQKVPQRKNLQQAVGMKSYSE